MSNISDSVLNRKIWQYLSVNVFRQKKAKTKKNSLSHNTALIGLISLEKPIDPH